jgi:hypothetical protein
LRIVELGFEFARRAVQVFAPADGGLRISRIGEMRGIVDAGAV